MAARMIDVVPQEMMREPFSLETGDPEQLDEIVGEEFESIDVRGNLGDGMRWALLRLAFCGPCCGPASRARVVRLQRDQGGYHGVSAGRDGGLLGS